jgi:hypothetical protein
LIYESAPLVKKELSGVAVVRWRSAEQEAQAEGTSAQCVSEALLERDDFTLVRHHALDSWWSMIFSENRYPLFGIML